MTKQRMSYLDFYSHFRRGHFKAKQRMNGEPIARIIFPRVKIEKGDFLNLCLADVEFDDDVIALRDSGGQP